MSVESRLLLDKVEEAANDARNLEIPVTNAMQGSHSERAEALKAAFEANVNMVFDHGLKRLEAVRHAVNMAEQVLTSRRDRMLEAANGLVYTLQELERHTEEMQQSIGDTIIATEQV